MVADVMAAAARVGWLSTMAEHKEELREGITTLNRRVKIEIANVVKRSAEQKKGDNICK